MSIPKPLSPLRQMLRCALLAMPIFGIGVTLSAQSTRITVSDRTQRAQVKHLGVNLSGQNFYDSGQMMRNLIYRNPGFEGEIWQTILHCKTFTQKSCTDENPYTTWPADFLTGAHYEVLSGSGAGATGTVIYQDKAASPLGVNLRLSPMSATVHDADFLLVKIDKPGYGEAGWWTGVSGGAKLSAELHDLSPETPGRQALSVLAGQPGQHASLTQYFDTLDGHSFVQLKVPYRLSFRAKPISGAHALHVRLQRQDTTHGMANFLDKTVDLAPGWHDYHFDMPLRDKPGAIGHMALTFDIDGANLLLDDVSLEPAAESPSNPTAFRDEVVTALRDLRPGVLRYMDNGASFGSSIDNLLAPQFGRQRAGASTQSNLAEDIPIGLVDFLVLCEAINAEPWITLPPGLAPTEMAHFVEFLAGPVDSPYGKRRAAAGHPRPWAQVFPTIHLELGNEQWNNRSFAGATLNEPKAYATRVTRVFQAARSSPYYNAQHFDLIAGSWFAVPWWTEQEAKSLGSAADTVALAPYLFSDFQTAPNPGEVFSAMFAQPEQIDSTPDGLMHQQLKALTAGGKSPKLAIYETNLGTAVGSPTITQAAIDLTVPSVGAGLALADHMLLMMRDLGITNQCVFALSEYRNGFTAPAGPNRTTPLWGIVVDMGGATNRRRPTFLSIQMANKAIMPTMLATQLDGANPQWNQALSTNDKIALQGAHELQTFAFSDGDRRSLIVFNLNRDVARHVTFDGPNAPSGTVEQTVLTSAHITDSNEDAETVKPVTTTLRAFQPHDDRALPPFSMTVYTWQRGR